MPPNDSASFQTPPRRPPPSLSCLQRVEAADLIQLHSHTSGKVQDADISGPHLTRLKNLRGITGGAGVGEVREPTCRRDGTGETTEHEETRMDGCVQHGMVSLVGPPSHHILFFLNRHSLSADR